MPDWKSEICSCKQKVPGVPLKSIVLGRCQRKILKHAIQERIFLVLISQLLKFPWINITQKPSNTCTSKNAQKTRWGDKRQISATEPTLKRDKTKLIRVFLHWCSIIFILSLMPLISQQVNSTQKFPSASSTPLDSSTAPSKPHLAALHTHQQIKICALLVSSPADARAALSSHTASPLLSSGGV